ncbi:MAG: N-acetyl-gamma-glutamyl-phosphate reductase, partial [Pseudomonadota bacterium]|nr:N-acetyl-gamma-glutamyl-phosphate reductase [Pseudomonadota bacterium]
GHIALTFSEPSFSSLSRCDVVFFATPNGTAMQLAPELLAAHIRVIDLAADFRLQQVDIWKQWYGMEHACPELLAEAVYGLPEQNRQAIQSARLVACPGCYPTAVQLGFLPLLKTNALVLQTLIADVKSGVSGAGRKAQVATLMGEVGESFKAYNVSGHRHWPEIYQGLTALTPEPLQLTFVPHLVPMIRGIFATLYAQLRDGHLDAHSIMAQYYQNEPFVEVLPPGTHPETRTVRGSNQCQIAVHQTQQRLVILVVIDNLVKGAAGQAIQNMNIMYQLPETWGLDGIALLP